MSAQSLLEATLPLQDFADVDAADDHDVTAPVSDLFFSSGSESSDDDFPEVPDDMHADDIVEHVVASERVLRARDKVRLEAGVIDAEFFEDGDDDDVDDDVIDESFDDSDQDPEFDPVKQLKQERL